MKTGNNQFKKILFAWLGGMAAAAVIFPAYLLLAPRARAQGAALLTVTPAVIDAHGLPQDILNYTLTVTNNADNEENIFASVYELTADGKQAFTDPASSNRPELLADWIGISRGAMLFAPHETKSIPVTITINPYATAGDYHAVIAFVAGNTRAEAEENLDGAPQAIVNMSVASNQKEVLELVSFAPERRFLSYFPATVAYTIKNTGDVPSTPAGEVIFYDHIGHELGSAPANPDNATIAPGDTKSFTAAWSGNGSMGQYRAALDMTYGATQSDLADTAMFWVLPWEKVTIVFLILLAGIIAAAAAVHRRYERKHHERRRLLARMMVPPTPHRPKDTVDLRHPHHEK